jgi:hypothetical protein
VRVGQRNSRYRGLVLARQPFTLGVPLSTQSVIRRPVEVAVGRFAPGHLGELTQIVPFEMVDAALASTSSVQKRVRDLPSRVVVYLLLAAGLFAEGGYQQVWARLTAGLEPLTPARPGSSALAQARRRVGAKPLRALFELLAGPAAGATRWRGLLVCAVDGTTMSVPDSAANLRCYSRQSGTHGGSGYPLMRMLTIVACGTRTVVDAVFGSTLIGETTYAPRLFGCLRPGMLLLADRNFAAQNIIAGIADTDADLLIRCKDNRKLPRIGRCPGSDPAAVRSDHQTTPRGVGRRHRAAPLRGAGAGGRPPTAVRPRTGAGGAGQARRASADARRITWAERPLKDVSVIE